MEAVPLLLAVGAECGLAAPEPHPSVAGFDARALLQGGPRACARAALEAASRAGEEVEKCWKGSRKVF